HLRRLFEKTRAIFDHPEKLQLSFPETILVVPDRDDCRLAFLLLDWRGAALNSSRHARRHPLENRILERIMARKRTSAKGALELLEEAVHLLRLAPLQTWLCYYIGALPFVLG